MFAYNRNILRLLNREQLWSWTVKLPIYQYQNNASLSLSPLCQSSSTTWPRRNKEADGSPTLSYYEVSREELRSSLKDPEVLVIDVRNPEELQQHGTILGSINIPLPELGATLQLSCDAFRAKFGREKPDLDSEIVFSCMAGIRSTKALKLARDMGFTEARHFPGGWKDWSSSA